MYIIRHLIGLAFTRALPQLITHQARGREAPTSVNMRDSNTVNIEHGVLDYSCTWTGNEVAVIEVGIRNGNEACKTTAAAAVVIIIKWE